MMTGLNKAILFLTFILFLSQSSYLAENSDKVVSSLPLRSLSEKSLAFQAGERLNYVIHYKWGWVNSDVAKGSISIDTVRLGGERLFKARLFGRTVRFYDTFFRVREDFASWFTVNGMRPVRFTRDTREGGYYVKNTFSYIWAPQHSYIEATIESRHKDLYITNIPLSESTYDIPSLFCLARNLDFSKIKKGERYPLVFAIDDEVFTIYLIFEGREKKRLKGTGDINTLKFAATLVAGEIFDGSADMYMWFTDDENRIPVFFYAPIKVGEITGYLESYEGLKHPFNSIVKM